MTNINQNYIKKMQSTYYNLIFIIHTKEITMHFFSIIYQTNRLCNETRLQVNHLGRICYKHKCSYMKECRGHNFHPRMNLVQSDLGLPFKFQRKQYSLALCLTMTINKSQEQSLSHVGIYLLHPIFTHCQLYVALSRVKSRGGLKMLILEEDQRPTNTTKNVVYRKVFENVQSDPLKVCTCLWF